MLIEFFGKNFGCFRDEFRLSMEATDIDPDDTRGLIETEVNGDPEPLRLLRCVGIYGANASGKSTIVRAAEALRMLLTDLDLYAASGNRLPSYEPFALDESENKPSELGIVFVSVKDIYKYSISFDAHQIVSEQLEQLNSSPGRMLFARERERISGAWQSDPVFRLIVAKFRKHVPFAVVADTLAPHLSQSIMRDARACLDNEGPSGSYLVRRSVSQSAKKAHAEPQYLSWLKQFVRAADLGVIDVEIEKLEGMPASVADLPASFGSGRGKETQYSIKLRHQTAGGSKSLPLQRESTGTLEVLQMSPLFYSLSGNQKGGAFFKDEFGGFLHGEIVKSIIGDVNRTDNPRNRRGQLIFTTHETVLIDGSAPTATLRRDQVYFTQKDKEGAAKLYSLSDFKERQNVNYRKRYLEGRYGAMPNPNSIVE